MELMSLWVTSSASGKLNGTQVVVCTYACVVLFIVFALYSYYIYHDRISFRGGHIPLVNSSPYSQVPENAF